MPTLSAVTRISLKTILFPTDFSPASAAAFPFAQALARIYGSTMLLAHAIAPEPHGQVVMDRLPAQDDQAWEDARHRLAELTRSLAQTATPYKALLDRGDLAEVIPDIIREHAVDLVVLGTHGRRGVKKMLLGSDAEKIYRLATCPVMTVGPKAHSADWTLRRILCPVDVAEDPEPALHYALSLAEENQAQIIVLQAVPMVPWQHRPSMEQTMRVRLEALIPNEAKNWCTPQFVVRWDHVPEAIVLAAADFQADVIVMGVHRARAAGLASHLPWPVASEVVSRAGCPVLTVRV